MTTAPGHPGFTDEYAALRKPERTLVGKRKRVLPISRRPTMAEAIRAALRRAASRTAEHGVPFDLTQRYVEDRVAEAGGCCEVSGVAYVPDYDPERRFSHNPYGFSIDRIEPTLGYVEGNVRFVITAVNFAINQWGMDAYLRIAQATVVKHYPRRR